LLALEAKALPFRYRMRGAYRDACTGICLAMIGLGPAMIPDVLGL
jgi:hypothetical protein